MDDLSQTDYICRVCRCEGQSDLFHPCICTGSIKWIHQDCLMQWMRYSRKEYCELCGHRFSFTPIYSPDMPRVLPLRDVAGGLLSSIATAVKYWLHYTLVALAWLGVVPFTAYRTYRFLFSASYDMLLSLPINMFSTENIAADVFRGCFVVTCTLFSFIGLVWLREQILHGGGPDWLERDDAPVQEPPNPPPAPPMEQEENLVEANNNINNNNNNNLVPPNVMQEDNPPRARFPQVAPVDRPMDRAEPPVVDQEEPEIEQEAVGDEANWNPMEWDRAAEELTWERLLGLDGSMVFLEHVFWVISLNTLFIFIFAFCPYSIGNSAIFLLGILKPGKPQMHFHGLLTTLLGYCIIGITLVKLHALAKFFKMRKSRRILGLCYIVVKVSLLSVVEIGVLPLACGWWLDICSLPMFDASLKDRKASFKAAPGTSLFIHWMFGMVYVYYFASFIILLREVLRPGVLWFLRNLNDPDFSPIQEMIHFSILRHIRRLVASAIIFGSAVLLMLWLPINILKNVWPTFLPYTLSGDSEVNELSLQLLLLQIILPGFFEQSQTRVWLKGFIRIWCSVVSWILGIRSYLLGNEDHQQNAGNDDGQRNAPEAGQGLGAAHQALLHRDVPVGFQPYDRPSYFILRLVGLICFMCVSLVIGSLLTLTIPVWIGRQCMALWSVGGHISQTPVAEEVPPRPHELYTAAMGTYLCWIISRGIAIAVNLFPQGRQAVMQKIKHWMSIGASYAMAAVIFVLMFGVVPLLYGLLLELVVVVPLRVPLEQTPILFLGQDWALGVLYTKITCALTLMGPDWALKRAIERAYRDGLRDIDLKFIIKDLAAPVIMCFGLALAVPYVLAHSILPMFFTNQHTRTLLARRIYPFFLIVAVVIGIIVFQIRQFKKLYVAIKNDKYLVGQRLVNYDHRKRRAEAAAAAAAAAQAQMM
ncbi:E3 ubiquitin-protein ligase MARCHF6 [Phlebotomus argentipes]|uniref:E3 ubiquitin-protein ligase MARCHF6 n=1 Tax=Phlebotomus argentipes TaxID=94469 RepID=UPI002893023C|nr:E3 ubiquitin-protein ligase MARCHF6 [Phlebotomus argentipes]